MIIAFSYSAREGYRVALSENFLLLSLTLFTLCLIFVAIACAKERLICFAVLGRSIKRERRARGSIYFPPPSDTYEKREEEGEIFLPKALVDSVKADSLISNKMAKNLLRRDGRIKAFGKKKRAINISELSRAFSPGERVDINRMKAVGLISYDVAEIKVLGGGVIDKKLFVYANGFSHSAVKMIALMGGEAVKVDTARVKIPKEIDE